MAKDADDDTTLSGFLRPGTASEETANSLRFSRKLATLRAGDGFFVPRDCRYVYSGGPEGAEVLEFRFGAETHFAGMPRTYRVTVGMKIR